MTEMKPSIVAGRGIRWRQSVAILGTFWALLNSSCQDPERSASQRLKEKQANPEANGLGRIQVPLPVERVLTDNQGRPLDARIIGKNKTHLTVIRKLDGERFAIAIASLSDGDQDFVAGLLDQRPPPAEPGQRETAEERQESATERELERWNRELDIIDEKIEELQYSMRDPNLNGNSPRVRGMQKEVDRLRDERREIEKWLEKVRARSNPE